MPSASSNWSAVSAVIAALPLMISLTVFNGRAIRWANSTWVMPRSCNASRRISPGATAQSGCHPGVRSLAMIVDHLLYYDLRHASPVNASVRKLRQRVMVRLEDQPVRAPQVYRELAGPV